MKLGPRKTYRGKLIREGRDHNGNWRYLPPLISVHVGDLETPARLLKGCATIDTGAQLSSISLASMSKLGLEFGDETVLGVGMSDKPMPQRDCWFSFVFPGDDCRFKMHGSTWDSILAPHLVMNIGMDVLRWCHFRLGPDDDFSLSWHCNNDHLLANATML
jgi:hypothetical protein